ncbi:MAG: DUF4911 domain-containing protein [Nitrospinae bacterium]|nr:DUF4911 domain-containing protein [Nitrospinota bacterium]
MIYNVLHGARNFRRTMGVEQTKVSFPLQRERGDSHRILIQVNPADIAWVVMVVESHEFLGVPRTIDQSDGIVEILTTGDFVEDALALLESLKGEIPLNILNYR